MPVDKSKAIVLTMVIEDQVRVMQELVRAGATNDNSREEINTVYTLLFDLRMIETSLKRMKKTLGIP